MTDGAHLIANVLARCVSPSAVSFTQRPVRALLWSDRAEVVGAPAVDLSIRGLFIELVLEHLPAVYHHKTEWLR